VQHGRFDGSGGRPQGFVIGEERPPSQKRLAFLGDDSLEELFSELKLADVRSREECADAIFSGSREFDADPATSIFEELVRNLDQDPGTIPRVIFTATSTSMVEILKGREAISHELVRLAPLEIGDEADSTGVVLVSRIIKALGPRIT
jgi:hypothetical protein